MASTQQNSFSARRQAIKLGLLLVALSSTLVYGDWVWRWDRLIYDMQASLIHTEARDDLVIVAIDETSLNNIGRWPWPRSVHAELIKQLNQHQVRAVVFDIIFSEADITDPQTDLKLQQAIEQQGQVALPVLLEQTRLRGHLLETLPLPKLSQVAASLGHVHVELDGDGIARGTFLYEGLGSPHWPHIGLALWNMLDVDTAAARIAKPDTSTSTSTSTSAENQWRWHRQHYFMIPYIGPPGSFQTISYQNLLNNQVLPGSLRDKIILVGVTATGLGDALPTPVSGLTHPMPGIEVNANIIQAIRDNTLIQRMNNLHLYLLIFISIFIPTLLLSYLTPRQSLLFITATGVTVFITTWAALALLHVWIPVSAILLSLILAYPLWAWQRLEFTVNYLNAEFELLSQENRQVQQLAIDDPQQPLEYIQTLIPVDGLRLHDLHTPQITLISIGTVNEPDEVDFDPQRWIACGPHHYARGIKLNEHSYGILVNWSADIAPDEQQNRILKIYLHQLVESADKHQQDSGDIIESRVQDIQQVTHRLAYLRHFISDSLEQMADGVVVINSLGMVILANQQSAQLVGVGSSAELLHQPVLQLLNTMQPSGNENWETIINTVLQDHQYDNLQLRTRNNTDLVINIKPLRSSTNRVHGFIINMSDITEIKNAQRKRNEMLSFLSHDLRSPLVSVLAMLEQQKLEHDGDPQNTRIENNVHRTIQLAEDFVHLSRIEDNDNISFAEVNLSDVIANAVDTLWDQADRRGIQIDNQLSNDIWLNANGAMLERVFTNLLSNAIKFSAAHSQCRITIEVEIQQEQVKCCVEDQGSGIAEEDMAHLFDRFSRARTDRPGIGLGLAFVHAAIAKHGGYIDVHSKLNKGSRFCLFLPIHTKQQA